MSDAPRGAKGAPSTEQRIVVLFALLGALLFALGWAGAGAPVLWGLLAWCLGRSWRTVIQNLPSAAVLLVALATVAGLAVSITPFPLLRSGAFCRTLLVAPCVGMVLLVVVRQFPWSSDPEREARVSGRLRVSLLAFVPGTWLLGIGLVLAVAPRGVRLGWFLGGDNLRHVVLVAQEWNDGSLDYAANAYPRAWHSAVTILWATNGAGATPEGFASLLRLLPGATWLVYVAMTLAAGAVAFAAAQRIGLTSRCAGLAGLLAGCSLLLPWFTSSLVLGFETATVASLALAAASFELLSAGGTIRCLMTSAAAMVVVSNSWQLLLPAAALVAVAAGWAYARPRPWPRLVVILLVGVAMVGLALPPFRAISSQGGVGLAATPGDVRALPMSIALAVLAGALAIAVLARRDLRVLGVSGMAIGTATSAALLAARAGVSLSSYFPAKTITAAVVLAIPLASAAVADLLRRLENARGSRRLLLPLGLAALAVWVVGGVIAPLNALRGGWSSADAGRVARLLTAPRVAAASVVWLGQDAVDAATTRILMDFYHVQDGAQITALPAMSLPEQCTTLQKATVPVVLSDLDPAVVRAHFACAPNLEVVGP